MEFNFDDSLRSLIRNACERNRAFTMAEAIAAVDQALRDFAKRGPNRMEPVTKNEMTEFQTVSLSINRKSKHTSWARRVR